MSLLQLQSVQNVYWLWMAVILALFCIGFVILTRRGSEAEARFERKPLLSAWEAAVFEEITRQLQPGLHLCPQVRVADMLWVAADDASANRKASNRIRQWSVDFAVLDFKANRTILVIELDDRTHDRPDRKRRDLYLNEAMAKAGIPIARFRPKQPIRIGDLIDQMQIGVKENVGLKRRRSAAAV